MDGLNGKYGEPLGDLLIEIPAPNFAELIRILPKIGEAGIKANGIGILEHSTTIKNLYMVAPTEPEAMAKVEEYLMKLL